MTGTQTLIARAVLGAGAAIASVLLASSKRLLSIHRPTFDRGVLAAMAVSRLGLFFLVFLVLHVAPRGDIQAFYFPQAVEVLRHHLPYRDFVSSYAPLHPYLDAVFVKLWATPLSIMLFSVLVELAVLPLWWRVGPVFLAEREVRVASLLYLASPVSLQFVVVDGQDNVLIAALMALSMLLLARRRGLLSGATLAVTVAAVKFLPLLYMPAYFLASPRRWRWAIGAGLVLAAVYGGFTLLHAPILQPLSAEGELRSAGNLPFLVESLFGITLPGRVSDLVLLLALAVIFTWIARATLCPSFASRLGVITFGTCALTLALLLLAKKSWPPYLMLSLFPVCLLPLAGRGTSDRLRIILYACFSFVAVTEHSVWASLLGMYGSAELHQALLTGDAAAMVFLLLQVLLLAGYGWLLYEAMRRIVAVVPQGIDSQGAID